MIRHRIQLAIIAGTVAIVLMVIGGTAILLDRGERAAMLVARQTLERDGEAVEIALSRQLLQVHGALASLPALFKAANASPQSAESATEILRGINFQTLAYRDLMLVGPDGKVLASARPRSRTTPLPFDTTSLRQALTGLVGPIRNPVTGDWSLYVARAIPEWNGITPVAEVPLPTLMRLLAETGIDPDVRIELERPDGQLIAAVPHDEIHTGRIGPDNFATRPADGRAFLLPSSGPEGPDLAVVRASLSGEVRVVLIVSVEVALANWRLDRDRIVAAAGIGALLLIAFSGALLVALRQREKAEAQRTRSATVLRNAIEAMSDGFVMWDEQDRLVTCNQQFRNLYAPTAPLMKVGARFEDIVRQGVAAGLYPDTSADMESVVAEMVAFHRQGEGSAERQLADGRWILVRERPTSDGGIVGIRTDITPLKAALAELAEANRRANEATAEARRQNAALVERESRIRYLAHHDHLTRLPNRVLLRERIETALRTAGEQGARVALLYLDLDRFKDINDTLGHPIGDALLRMTAERLSGCVNDVERIARLGGDEFAVICVARLQPDEAERLSERIIRTLSAPYQLLGHTITSSVSVGIALADSADCDADVLLKQADLALYHAKAQGRGVSCLFAPEMDARLRARLEMQADLRDALARGEFELAYQPIYELATERLCGFEALLRWRHPRHGVILPSAFVPLAEEMRLIVGIGAWVLDRACKDLAKMPADLHVSVNLSPVQLASGNLVETVQSALDAAGLDPPRLELEIAETALLHSEPRNIEVLRRLKDIGAAIVLDDFGSGYSSLSHLRFFPLSKIKIDRSFVRDITVRDDSVAIVTAIAALARRLGMRTTAEGVETAEQWEIARRIGCTEAQGFFPGRAQSLDLALEIAETRRRPANRA
ncbi:MAG: diguanylate cyclase [Ancylobacter novellus]|uniref:Diguanylate cyclase n=1 Tax=Ancylobacter novellus TaxID=921 RepID=A0A2W5R879_ANCNO|nr:MAG: diguanylate cyclase [Ancylobacter novellus]